MTRTQGADALDSEAQRLYDSGDYEGAMAAATRAIELQPDRAGTYRLRARIFKALGLESAARQDYQRGAALGDDAARRELWSM